VGHMPMAPPLVLPPIVRPARPHRVLAALPRRRWLPAAPGQAPDPVTPPALDRETKPGPAPVAALAAEAEQAVVAGPALALATLPVLAPAISPAEVGTNSRFGGKYLARQPRSPGLGSGACFAHGSSGARLAVDGASIANVEGVDHGSLQARVAVQ
jgi:hypothetical protein